jgi:DNA-binding transcriptional LysR family regulator
MENRLFFVGSSALKFDKTTTGKKLFEELPIIYREHGSATRNAMEQFIEKNKFSVLKKIELTSNEAVKQAVISGLGCSIMPLIGIKNEMKNNDLQIIPIKGLPISTNWNLIWLKSKKLSPAALAYVDYINAEKDAIIKDKFNWFINN